MIDYKPTHEVFTKFEYYSPEYSLFSEKPEDQKDDTRIEIKENVSPEISNPDTEISLEPNVENLNEEKMMTYDDKNKFITDLQTAYSKELSNQGINPEYAKYLIAQDILESGWGKKIVGDYNYGNITVSPKYENAISWKSGGDKDGTGKSIIHKFRNFKSLEDYVLHKINLLKSQRYNAFSGNPEDFYYKIQKGGYAEDPNYLDKLKKITSQIKIAKSGIKLPSFLKIKKSGLL